MSDFRPPELINELAASRLEYAQVLYSARALVQHCVCVLIQQSRAAYHAQRSRCQAAGLVLNGPSTC